MLWPLVVFLLQAQELRLTSEGKPTAARVYIVDSSGHALRIPGAVSYSRREEVHSYVDGSASVSLPPGRYLVRAEKGMAYGKACAGGPDPARRDCSHHAGHSAGIRNERTGLVLGRFAQSPEP